MTQSCKLEQLQRRLNGIEVEKIVILDRIQSLQVAQNEHRTLGKRVSENRPQTPEEKITLLSIPNVGRIKSFFMENFYAQFCARFFL